MARLIVTSEGGALALMGMGTDLAPDVAWTDWPQPVMDELPVTADIAAAAR